MVQSSYAQINWGQDPQRNQEIESCQARKRSMKFWKREDFKRQNEEWRKKLAESGFKDIEKANEQLQPNIVRDSPESIEYFQALIRNIYGDGRYFVIPDDMSPIEITVLALKAEGLRVGEIARRTDIHRMTVIFIIRRYEHIWGIKTWTAKQRNQRG